MNVKFLKNLPVVRRSLKGMKCFTVHGFGVLFITFQRKSAGQRLTQEQSSSRCFCWLPLVLLNLIP